MLTATKVVAFVHKEITNVEDNTITRFVLQTKNKDGLITIYDYDIATDRLTHSIKQLKGKSQDIGLFSSVHKPSPDNNMGADK